MWFWQVQGPNQHPCPPHMLPWMFVLTCASVPRSMVHVVRNELAGPVQTNPKIFLDVGPCLSWDKTCNRRAEHPCTQTLGQATDHLRQPYSRPSPCMLGKRVRNGPVLGPLKINLTLKQSERDDKSASVVQDSSLVV